MNNWKKLVMISAFLFIVNVITVQEVLSQDVTVYDLNGRQIGFVDDFGLYHKFKPDDIDISAMRVPRLNSRILLQETVSNLADVPLTQDEFAWPMFQSNREHNGYLPISLEPGNFSLRWQKNLAVSSPVTAADGFVIFTSGATLYVLDAVDGEAMWSKSLSGYHVGHPSYGYGNVYIQTCNHSSDTWLHAINATTGEYVFKSGTSAQWENYYSPTLYDGKAYINGGYYGGTYAYNAFSGVRLWFRELNQYDEWTPAVDANYIYAYIGESCSGCNNAGLNIVNRQTGAFVRRIVDSGFDWQGWSMNLAPVLGGMGDVLAIHNGRLLCFDIINNTIKYQVGGSFIGQPVIAKGEIYTINGGKLDVRDEATGNVSWGWQPPEGSLTGYLAVTDSHVFARTSSNTYAIDLYSRDMVWSYPAAGNFAIANETLYIGTGASLIAIAAEAKSPSNPVAVEIEGPQEVNESSQAEYKSIVHYDDGRVRYRTLRTKWSVEPNEWAEIDEKAILHTEELINPKVNATITAVYTENDITLTGQKNIDIVIDCNIDELVHRNLTKAIEEKKQILSILDSALSTELATANILRPTWRCDIFDKCSKPARNKMYSQTMRAILLERFAERWINMSLEDLNSTDSLLLNGDPEPKPKPWK
jgi:hypothetical protein